MSTLHHKSHFKSHIQIDIRYTHAVESRPSGFKNKFRIFTHLLAIARQFNKCVLVCSIVHTLRKSIYTFSVKRFH